MNALTAFAPTDAEGAVLGIILQAPAAIAQVKDLLRPTDFLLPQNRVLYTAMLALTAQEKRIETGLLLNELGNRVDETGGPAYWAGLQIDAPLILSLLDYIEIVQQQSQRVRLHEALDSIGLTADPDAAIDALRGRLEDIEAIRQRVDWDDRRGAADELVAWIEGEQAETTRGIQTGLPSLDHYMNGMRPQQLIVVGGRTGVGKTSFVVTITHHVGMVRRLPVLFLSAEMDRAAIRQKLLSIAANIPWSKLDAQDLTDLERKRALRQAEEMRTCPVFVVQCGGWTTTQIRRWARLIHTAHPLNLVVVDYLQFIRPARSNDSRVNEVSSVARDLKEMAIELDVPLLTPAQLNRDAESTHRYGGAGESKGRPEKKAEPTLKDLKDSSEIEQSANVVILLWKEHDAAGDSSALQPVEPVLAKVAKNRMGKRGTFTLGFRADYMEFVEMNRAPF